MEGLLDICMAEGIEIHYITITDTKNVLGYYYRAGDDSPIIMLDESLRENPRLKRCVLAEEVGHHMAPPTSSINGLHRSIDLNRLNRTNCKRDDSRALRWAVNYLIPTCDLADVAKRGITTVDEIAEEFDVIRRIVWKKLQLLRQEVKGYGLRTKGARDMLSPLLAEVMWGDGLLDHA